MQIVPMRDLKNTVKIEALCAKTKAPVFITKNGYGKLVIMDLECFDRLMNQIYEAKAINDGIADLEKENIIDIKQTKEKLKEKYGF